MEFQPRTRSLLLLLGLSLVLHSCNKNEYNKGDIVSYINAWSASSHPLATGNDHTCVVLSTGTVKCWGLASNGQLGNGSTSNQTTPVTVSNISSATAVSAGYNHTCAELSGGTVQCWGNGGYGRLGNGSSSSTSTPVTVSGL